MNILYLFVFVFGTIIGSFLNVVILRMNTGLTLQGRSQCFSCGNTLSWYELLPVVSYFFLRGRCRSCRSKISWQYPFVEVLAGLVYLALFIHLFNMFGLSMIFLVNLFLSYIGWAILIVILVYDYRHQIIPDSSVLLFIAVSILYSLFKTGWEISSMVFISSVISAGILFSFFFFLWFVSDGRWVGFGDAKLSIGIGFYLGIAGGLSALAFAFWSGAIVAVAILCIQRFLVDKHGLSSGGKTLTMKSAIPFAPFLILGMFVALMFQSDVFGIHNFFPYVL